MRRQLRRSKEAKNNSGAMRPPQEGINRREFLEGAGGMVLAAMKPASSGSRDSLTGQSLPRRDAVPGAVAIGHQYRQDDMPSIAVAPDSSVWASWLSFDGERDDIALRHFRDNEWQDLQWVPGTSGDSWLPQVVVEKSNCVWAVWSQQVNGSWDIYGRRFDPSYQQWGKLERLSSGLLPDINLRAWSDGNGRAALVWQAFRSDPMAGRAYSNIYLRTLEGAQWSSEIQVTNCAANHWSPAAAIDSGGTVWVAYDTYANGNYDVMMTPVRKGGVVGTEIPVAATRDFEARASLAIDSQDRIWVAWEAGRPNWGKDNGKILDGHQKGVPLGGFREPRIACYDGGRWLEPQSPIASAFAEANTYQPHVFSDGSGSVWVIAKMRKYGPPPRSGPSHKLAYWEYWAKSPFGYWEYWATHLEADEWTEALPLPNSKGRLSTRMNAALGADNRLWLTWPTDNRKEIYYHRPVRQQVYAAALPAAQAGITASLKVRTTNFLEPQAEGREEMADVRALRAYTASLQGGPHRVLRGDLHRHTELSWDEGGDRDGSLEDFYRYMIDVASMDFGANTDHQGGAWPYWWWYSQKMADMYHLPGTYVSLFSHERSTSYPHGHRNVFFAKRADCRVIPFNLQEGVSLYAFPLTSEGDEPADETPQVVSNDTDLLYEELRARHGIAIPHTTGTGMGTDWHVHDSEVEPVVEIFQGMRQSYEQIGAPYAVTEEDVSKDAATPTLTDNPIEKMLLQMFRIRPDGMVTNAWGKGYQLGVIASSDHISTHLSYAMVYTDDPTREGIIEAIRRRHTYGATDNILLAVTMGEHFMGDSFSPSQLPPLHIHARGTHPIATIDILKDGKVIHTANPNQLTAELEVRDPEPDPRRHYYYVRLLQQDGMAAWSSPFFVNYT